MSRKWKESDVGTALFCKGCNLIKPAEEFRLPGGGWIDSKCSPCKKLRQRTYVANNKGKEAARKKKWNQDNPEANDKRAKDWYEQNTIKAKETRKTHYDNNAELYVQSAKEWKKANPTKSRAIQAKAQHKRRLLAYTVDDGTITHQFLLDIYEQENCYYCKKPTPYVIREAEHKIPLSRGGLHSASNIVMSCKSCNLDKGTMTDTEFFADLAARSLV